jgi:hypothetical protein
MRGNERKGGNSTFMTHWSCDVGGLSMRHILACSEIQSAFISTRNLSKSQSYIYNEYDQAVFHKSSTGTYYSLTGYQGSII